MKEFEKVIKMHLLLKSGKSRWSQGKFFEMFREQMIVILFKLSQSLEK